MKGILSFALGLVALSPIAVLAEEQNRRHYPDANNRFVMTLDEGTFATSRNVTAFERDGDTYTIVPLTITQNGIVFVASYEFNCRTEQYRLEGITSAVPVNMTPFVEEVGLVKPYGNRFCAIDRGKRAGSLSIN